MPAAVYNVEQTNYSQKNPVIKLLLNNFIHKIGELLNQFEAAKMLGLDAGCGEGHLIGRLRRGGVLGKMAAIDASTDYLAYARMNNPHCGFAVADLSRLPFPANTFDYIVTTEVFEHLHDPHSAMNELRRVGKHGAHLIISVPFEPFFHWGNIARGKYWELAGYTPDHKNLWRRYEFRRFLAPFVSIEREYGFGTFPWLLCGCRFR